MQIKLEFFGDSSLTGEQLLEIEFEKVEVLVAGVDLETGQATIVDPSPEDLREMLEWDAYYKEYSEVMIEEGYFKEDTSSSDASLVEEVSGSSNLSLVGNGQSFQSFMHSITGCSTSDALVPESTVNQELQDKLNAKLKPLHLDDLRKSGLSDEMIDKMGCVSMLNHEIHEKIYGTQEHSSKWNGATGYEIPYFDARGNTVLNRYRMFWTEQAQEDDPKLPKYMSPQKAATQIYVPHGFSGIKADYVIVTEGEKKAAKAVQEGFPCVALAGVDMWADSAKRRIEKDNGQRLSYSTAMHPQLVELLKERRVIVLFDSDADEKPQVAAARKRLKDAILFNGAAWCGIMSMPKLHWQKEGKVGLDDLLLCSAGKGLFKKNLSARLMLDSDEMSPLFELTYLTQGKNRVSALA